MEYDTPADVVPRWCQQADQAARDARSRPGDRPNINKSWQQRRLWHRWTWWQRMMHRPLWQNFALACLLLVDMVLVVFSALIVATWGISGPEHPMASIFLVVMAVALGISLLFSALAAGAFRSRLGMYLLILGGATSVAAIIRNTIGWW